MIGEAAFERPLFDVFADLATRQPDHLAVDDAAGSLTYAALHDRALALGARIAVQVPADGLVGIALPITRHFPVAWLACFAARRAFLPLDPTLPAARNQAIVAEAGLAAVVVADTMADAASWLPAGLPHIAMAGAQGDAPGRLPPGRPAAAVGMVAFTSGSTGRARGIALHERSIQRKALNYRSVGLGPNDRMLTLHPPTTVAGVRDCLGALLCGASLHLVDLKRDGLGRALTLLRDGGMTVCATVPAVARTLMAMDRSKDALRGLRLIRLGGDVIMDTDIAALAQRLPPTARILVGFGMTEAGGALIQRVIDPAAPLEAGRIAIGRPVDGQGVSLEDGHGNAVAPGEAGRLVIRGRYLALGHWVDGRLDPRSFPADPSAPGSRMFVSADMLTLRADGMLVPLGRADRLIKINGMRVEPGDTEAALRALPDVADAAVVAHGGRNAPVLVAFVVPAADSAAAVRTEAQRGRDWRKALAARLPPHQVPAAIRMVNAIPLLPSMKPDLAALRALAAVQDAVVRGPRVFARVRTWLRGARPRTAATTGAQSGSGADGAP
jgi:acyl-coenzyme A synthetase/AMP-(fatty) acid ligase